MHEQHHDRAPSPRAAGERPAFAPPRLELPRFQFASSSPLARDAAPASHPAPAPLAPQPQPQPQPAAVQRQPFAPSAPLMAPTTRLAPQHAPAMAQPQPQYAVPQQQQVAQQPLRQASPYANPTGVQQRVAVAYAAPAPMPAPAPAPVTSAARAMAASTATRPASVSWASAPAEPTFLQRITPVHMGALMVMVIVAMVVTSGPAAMSAKPTRLPALAQGGGTNGDPLLAPRAGTTATAAATAAGTAAKPRAKASAAPAKVLAKQAATPASKARAARRARAARNWIVVGSGRVHRRVRAGGIPSPAAAANLGVAGGGRAAAGETGNVNLNGIPSPAAAEALGPQKLPYRPNDGVTLPRMVGERDSHAVDRHYGADTLPMEAAVATPALTPGAAAARAEQQVALNAVTGSNAAPAAANGGLFTAH